MSAAFDWSKYEKAKPAEEEAFNWSKYQKAEPVSKIRSVAAAYPKGLLKGLSDLTSSLDPSQIVSKIVTGKDPNELLKRTSEQVLPTRDETTEQILGRAGELTPIAALGPESIGAKLAQLGGGTLLGHQAKESGIGELGQAVAEAVGMGLPGLIKGSAEGISNILKKEPEKFASGLTKPAAAEARFAEKAIISPERQKAVIKGLDAEAAALTKGVLSKRLPILQEIEKGVNFEQKFQQGFGELKKVAEKFNPQIETNPIRNLINETVDKYRGIPNLHPDAKKIVAEIKAIRKRPVNNLSDLLKTFRSNNQKSNQIFETSRLTGRQQEYVDFLQAMNRAITESIEKTLPKDSAWLKEFKNLNKGYKEFKNANAIQQDLKKILNEKVTPQSLEKFTDPKYQKKLELKIGKEGAQEIIQIAKDLKQAREAIKRIPVKEYPFWQKYLPFAFFLPGLGKLPSLIKVPDYARRAYGFILTMPERRKVFDEALKAIINNNKSGYIKATKQLSDEFGNSDSPE